MSAKRACQQCGELFMGRVDKKFCSDYCRTLFNNELNKDATKVVNRINHVLRKNRRILEYLNPNGNTKVHRLKLQDEGFNFDYFTNIYTTKANKMYYFCYDQGYLALDGDYYVLVRKKEYV
jgi:hypothetical protein